MAGVSLRSPRAALIVFAAVMLAVLAGVAWRYVERALWPSKRMPDLAYQAGEECVRQISAAKEGLLFAGLGIDPGAESHLRHDGNYESSGWVEEIDDYGHRIHNDWRCVLHYGGGDRWSVIYLHVGKYNQGMYVSE